MKNKLLLLTLIIISVFLLGNIKYIYKENTLYKQSDILDYSENRYESSNLISRNKAIKMATYIISDVLNIDIDSENSQIYINIYRDGSNSGDYNWNINWTKNDFSGNYSVDINSNTGEINDIYVTENINYKLETSDELSNKEIVSLVSDLTSALGFDLDDYNLNIKTTKDNKFNNIKTKYKICTFTKKNQSNDRFVITIDCRGGKITQYIRNPIKEVN